MAEAVIREFTKKELAFFHRISKEKYEMDMRAHKAEAREEGYAAGQAIGHAKGHAEGRAEGYEQARQEYEGKLEKAAQEKLEMARKMKGMGVPAGQIRAITGLASQALEDL